MTAQVAFLFPGQGSQAVGMGADAFAASPAAKSIFETVDSALGFSLSELCFQGPEETLRETINAQPAIVTVSLALLAALQESLSPTHTFTTWSSPLVPSYTAGHSVGEYAALVAAGTLDLKDAAQLVRERGRLMHHEGTVCPGGMAAVIGMDADALEAVCLEATAEASARETGGAGATHPGMGKVIVANFNAPGQIVISGELRALQIAMERAKARGAKRVIPLAVSGAFHSPVMQPAASTLAEAIRGTALRNASIPIISNISAMPLTTAEVISEELAQQIASSVQWTRTIEYLVNAGVTTFIEIGPGQALTGMVKRIAKGITTLNISSMADIEKAVGYIQDLGLPGDV
ncbi:MAG TPA: ACP S-malonyltransferase [Ktedonobacteraceae bacterium]|nr:ACP S-malonyltransferase [Ktedonobacteraceae bacterium]